MNDANRNARWARLIAEEVHRAGTGHVLLCPGSRNSPLLFALADAFGERALSHVDERSAGFIAIGLIRATGKPVAVCVTSGSALANLLPAVTEAAAAELPLIVISADRPWEQHGNGSPQSMPQRGILASFVRAELALGEPTDTDAALRALRSQISRLAQEPHGPTHLNVPLRDPLPPLPDPTWLPPAISDEALRGRPPQAYTSRQHGGASQPFQHEPWLRPGLRGLIVIGCQGGPRQADADILKLARATGFPVLADGPSGLRNDDVTNLITTFDALVGGVCAEELPELVIQIGAAPLTRAAYEWLDRCRGPWLSFATTINPDMLARATLAIEGDWTPALRTLAIRLAPGDSAWNARWRQADDHARRTLVAKTATLGWSESLAVNRTVNHPGFAFVHLASSMAVRHANLHLLPSGKRVFANRGVNGIDGTLGTFLGVAHASAAPGLVLLGDLAFLHDLPALAAAGLAAAGGAIVVLNNGGGAIFDYLPVAQVPDYNRWVRTSHSRTFAGAAELFGLTYHACRAEADLTAALTAATGGGALHLIECHLQGGDAVAQHRALIRVCSGLDGNAVRP